VAEVLDSVAARIASRRWAGAAENLTAAPFKPSAGNVRQGLP